MLRPTHYVLTLLLCTVPCRAFSQVKVLESEINPTSKRTLSIRCFAKGGLPDPKCTPGAVLTTDTTKVCKAGYTRSIRDVSLSHKQQVFEDYGIPWSLHSNYEVDHLISLELGGSNDLPNLWPQPSSLPNGSRTKDNFESYLHAQVCGGKIPIQEAQHKMATNWLAYYSDWLQTTTKASETDLKTPAARPKSKRALSTKILMEPAVKKSFTGICHAKGTVYYVRTSNFTPYNSLDECLLSGGRLPAP